MAPSAKEPRKKNCAGSRLANSQSIKQQKEKAAMALWQKYQAQCFPHYRQPRRMSSVLIMTSEPPVLFIDLVSGGHIVCTYKSRWTKSTKANSNSIVDAFGDGNSCAAYIYKCVRIPWYIYVYLNMNIEHNISHVSYLCPSINTDY
jgi:hypothetical protein